ncbi:MAG: NAD(P)H-hydrate epimerase [Faecalibacterium sp.]
MKHRIVTAAQMKEIERAGDAHGLPYLQMMENAGLAAYAELQKQFPHPGRLLVVCGKGNNGGDGFVIARAAAKDGWSVTVFLAEGEPKTADAILNFERLHSLPVHICTDCSMYWKPRALLPLWMPSTAPGSMVNCGLPAFPPAG